MTWFWHVLFDGTRLCQCEHSRIYRAHTEAARARRRAGDVRRTAGALRRARP